MTISENFMKGIEPLVHILMPVYNHSRYLETSINSVLNQKYSNLEIIIINDGSTEDVSCILNKFKNDQRVKIYQQPNQGLPITLTRLYEKSLNSARKPSFITWHSSDNSYEENAIATLTDFLLRRPELVFCFANVRIIDERGLPLTNSKYRFNDQTFQDKSVLNLNYPADSLVQFNDNFVNACFLVRASTEALQTEFRREDKGFEDYRRWLQLSLFGNGSHIGLNDPLYRYRLHNHSLTANLQNTDLHQAQFHSVIKTNKWARMIENDDLELVTRLNKTIFCKEKRFSFTNVKIFAKFLKSLDNPADLYVKTKSESKIPEKISLTVRNRLVLIHESHSRFYLAPPLSVSISNKALAKPLEIDGAIKIPSYFYRSRERDLQMFGHEQSDSLKVMIFCPSFEDETLIRRISKFVKENPDKIFSIYCYSHQEKLIADQIFIGSDTSASLRIVEESKCTNELPGQNQGLLNLIGSVDAIISLTSFLPETPNLFEHDAKVEIAISKVSLRPLLINKLLFENSNYFRVPGINLVDWRHTDKFPKCVIEKKEMISDAKSYLNNASNEVEIWFRHLIAACIVRF